MFKLLPYKEARAGYVAWERTKRHHDLYRETWQARTSFLLWALGPVFGLLVLSFVATLLAPVSTIFVYLSAGLLLMVFASVVWTFWAIGRADREASAKDKPQSDQDPTAHVLTSPVPNCQVCKDAPAVYRRSDTSRTWLVCRSCYLQKWPQGEPA